MNPSPFSTPPSGQGRQPPILNAPESVRWIAAALIGVHLIRAILPAEWDDIVLTYLAFIPQRLTAPDLDIATRVPGATALVTHMLLHGDFLHLLVNTFMFLGFGTPVARRMGTWPFVALVCLCGIFGAIFWSWLAGVDPFQIQFLIGASGAISGCVGVVGRLASFPPPGTTGVYPFRSREGALQFCLIWLGLNVVFGLAPELLGVSSAVAWQAHLGGFIAGFALAPSFDGKGLPPRRGAGVAGGPYSR